MKIKEAIELLEADGWEIHKCKYALTNNPSCPEDNIFLISDKQIISWAKALKDSLKDEEE